MKSRWLLTKFEPRWSGDLLGETAGATSHCTTATETGRLRPPWSTGAEFDLSAKSSRGRLDGSIRHSTRTMDKWTVRPMVIQLPSTS